MKNKIFSILLSLSLILGLGVNNSCYAEVSDLTKVTANIRLEASNSGINSEDTVSLNTYVKFVPETNFTGDQIEIKDVAISIEYDSSKITYSSFTENGDIFKSSYPDTSTAGVFNFTWANLSNMTEVNVNNEILVGTAIFKLNNSMNDGDIIEFSVDVHPDENGDYRTWFKDADDNAAQLPTSSVSLNYSLISCLHTNCESISAKDATCIENGNSAYWYCSDCGKYFSDASKTNETSLQDTVTTKLGHDIKKVEAKDVTCAEDGNTEYYRCTRCFALFSDESGTQSTTSSEVNIPATGHKWDEGFVTEEATYLKDGIKTYTCTDCGETKTESIPKLTHDDPNSGVQYWGTLKTHNGYEMYVDAEGKTSALVTGAEKIWVREESYDPSAKQNLAAWYMLDNTSGEFESGSRFWVQWLNNKDNPIEFLKHFNNIDQTIRDRIDSNRVWIFLVGVTNPDGITEYETLSHEIPLYIQMGTDWDYGDVKAMYISETKDEDVYASYLNMECPEGIKEFAKLSIKHFSPYAIYDYLTDEEKAAIDKTFASLSDEEKTNGTDNLLKQGESIKTGDEVGYIILMSSALLIIAGIYLEVCMKKKA